MDKVREEVAELEEAFAVSGDSPPTAAQLEEIERELGDVLMATAFLGQYLKLDAERACNRALSRFETRFRALESLFEGDLKAHTLEELMNGWERVKQDTREESESR